MGQFPHTGGGPGWSHFENKGAAESTWPYTEHLGYSGTAGRPWEIISKPTGLALVGPTIGATGKQQTGR